MTAGTPSSIDTQSAQLQQIWVDCLKSVVGQVAGFPITVEVSAEVEIAASGKPPVCMVISATKALQGDMAILTSEPDALVLAQILVSEPPDNSAAFDKDRRDAYEELIRQVLGQVATSLKKAAGGEVDVKPTGSEVPSWTGASRVGIRLTSEKFEPITLSLLVQAELRKSLEPRPAAPALPPQAATNAPGTAAPATDDAHTTGARSSNLELLLDVKLNATIRFGQKQMLLREILELHPGTAVALDRQVEEPVELLVGGRVIAQGNVVIVDGNYGIRITEILSPQQRIASLGK
jgi:flagellar motor switch protein FliN/FliY